MPIITHSHADESIICQHSHRLARNAAFTLALRDSGVDFVACDMPHADKFTIGLFALLAEKERDMISERTKAGLAAAKQRGIRLGNPKLSQARRLALLATQQKAVAYATTFAPVIAQMRKAGVKSLRELADCLNRRGYTTPQGKRFYPQSVRNLLQRLPDAAQLPAA